VLLKKAKRSLDEFYIEGFPTNISLHREIVRDEDFRQGNLTTQYLDKKMDLFNLNSERTIQQEEEKMSRIMKFVEKIKSHKLSVRN